MSSAGWRYIDDPPSGGILNMATDFALLTSCNQGMAPPTLRLYGWEQPTLTVGYSQTGSEAIDLNRCQQQQVSIVRRPTGGRFEII